MAKAKSVRTGARSGGRLGGGERLGRLPAEIVPCVVGSNLTPLSLFYSARHRKKTLLALFVAVATISLVAALVVAFKPDTNKSVAGKSEVRTKNRVVMHFRYGQIHLESLCVIRTRASMLISLLYPPLPIHRWLMCLSPKQAAAAFP